MSINQVNHWLTSCLCDKMEDDDKQQVTSKTTTETLICIINFVSTFNLKTVMFVVFRFSRTLATEHNTALSSDFPLT